MCCEVGPVSLSTKKPLHIFPRVACLLLLVGWGASHKGGSCCMYPTGAAFPQELLKASQARVMQGERKESTCQARDLVLSSWPCLGWSSRVGISACQLCLALLLSTDVCPWGWNPPSPPPPHHDSFPTSEHGLRGCLSHTTGGALLGSQSPMATESGVSDG